MKRGFSLALIYPAALALIAVAVVWGLIGYVVPRVVGVFEQASHELPMLTRSLLALSGLVASHGWLLLAVAALTAAGLVALRQPPVRRRFVAARPKLLGLGRWVRRAHVSTSVAVS